MEERRTSNTGLYVLLVVVLIAFLVWALVFARDAGDPNRNGPGPDPNGPNNGDEPPADPPPEEGNTARGWNPAPG